MNAADIMSSRGKIWQIDDLILLSKTCDVNSGTVKARYIIELREVNGAKP